MLDEFMGNLKSMMHRQRVMDCPGCSKCTRIKMPIEITRRFNEMQILSAALIDLMMQGDKLKERIRALKTLTWQEIDELYPEYATAARKMVSEDSTQLLIYDTCNDCIDPITKEE